MNKSCSAAKMRITYQYINIFYATIYMNDQEPTKIHICIYIHEVHRARYYWPFCVFVNHNLGVIYPLWIVLLHKITNFKFVLLYFIIKHFT